MRMYLRLIIKGLIVVSCLTSCDKFLFLSVDNRSNRDVLLSVFPGPGSVFYPDTLLLDIEPTFVYTGGVKSSRRIGGNSLDISWEKIYDYLPHDTLSYHLFDKDTLHHYGWNDVRTNYKILVRYDLSLDDILELDATITYPPSPAMRYMKMYPPYEEVLRREEEYNNRINN